MPWRLIVQKGLCNHFVMLPDSLFSQLVAAAAAAASSSVSASSAFGTTDTVELDSASRLVDVQTASLPDSSVFAVRSVQDLWQLIKSPTAELFAAADGITVAQSQSNPGQVWVRLELGSERWRNQTAWGIDSVNGHDENVGTVASPLRTWREFSRRMGPAGEIPATIDVTQSANDSLADDKLTISQNISVRPNAMFRFHGTPTILDSGTFTAVTDLNSATQTPPDVTDAAQNFAAYTNRRLRIVGGARDGAIAFVSLVIGATQVRTSAWGINNVAAVPYSPAVTLVNPQIGDAYVVESLPLLPSFDYFASKTSQGTQGAESALFESLKIGNSSNDRFNTGLSNVSISKCVIDLFNFYGRDQHVTLTNFITNSTFHIQLLTLRACLKRGGSFTMHSGSTIFFRDQSMAQGVPLVSASNNGFIEIFSAAAFDSSSNGIVVDPYSQMRISGLLWGDNNTLYGIRCDGRAEYVAAFKPTITGLVEDTRIGGTDFAYAAIPVVNATNNAMLVVQPT